MELFKKIRDFYVPATDEECHKVVFDSAKDLRLTYPYVKSFDVAVQAGGNFGAWPAQLAKRFKHVYTFEPDPLNFSCLCRNIGDTQNIIKIQAALGEDAKSVGLSRNPINAGAHFVTATGFLPMIKLDSLGLPACDLIILDIEGYELPALRGAFWTLRNFLPVVHVEEKGHGRRYGIERGEILEFLRDHIHEDYEVVEAPHRDLIFTVPHKYLEA